MKRVLYFTGYRLTAFHWEGKKLHAAFSFYPQQQSQDDFWHYLQQSKHIPAYLLIDVIEEDFKQASLPRLHGSHHKQLLSRYKQRLFRNMTYIHAAYQYKDTTMQRHDKYLFSALTNTNLIESWLTLLRESQILLKGIWSLPLLSAEILKLYKIKSNKVLLISQQIPGYIRQSFFLQGQMVFSRLNHFNTSSQPEEMRQQLLTEVNKTTHFLMRQHHIVYNDSFQIHLLLDDYQCTQFPDLSNETYPFFIHTVSQSNLKLSSPVTAISTQHIFNYLCTQQPIRTRHYYQNKDIHSFQCHQQNNYLYGISAGILLSATIFCFISINKAHTLLQTQNEVQHNIALVKNIYQDELPTLQSAMNNAEKMQEAVILAEKLQRYAALSPQNAYLIISHILSQKAFSSIQLSTIKWQTLTTAAISRNKDIPSSSVQVNLSGNIMQTGSLEQLINTMKKLLTQFKNHPDIIQVNLRKAPIDMQLTQTMTQAFVLSQQTNSPVNTEQKNHFEIELWINHD